MGVLECCRIFLYLVEWIWTTVILGIFPDQLAIEAPTVDGGFENACLFNANVGRSRCNFGIAWAAIAFVVLTCTIIWYTLEYCSTVQLPGNVETVIFCWLAIWWLVGAIALTVTKASGAPGPSNVPVAFAWMLFILSSVSAFIASRGPKKVEYRVSESRSENDNVESVYDEP